MIKRSSFVYHIFIGAKEWLLMLRKVWAKVQMADF